MYNNNIYIFTITIPPTIDGYLHNNCSLIIMTLNECNFNI